MFPNVVETWIGGLPEMSFWRTVLPVADTVNRTPIVFPPMMFLSTTLPLLVPIRPIPKELLTAVLAGLTEPFPLATFNRTRLLLLLVSHVPPQGNPAKAKFRAKKLCKMSLSVVPVSQIPL